MRKRLFITLLTLMLCSTTFADMYVNIATSPGSWPQAPYIITPTSDAPDWMPASFKTFCIERYVTFSPGNYRATIDERILHAGVVGGLELNEKTKKIYAAFLNGALDSVAVTTVQTSVWGALDYGNYVVDGAIANIISDDAATSGWQAVKALNLWGANGLDVQSQLVKTPLPGAALLGVLGLGFASSRLRRRRRTA